MSMRRSQPPGDSGSRKKLTESGQRKGDIDNVEHAYSGIINVYALRPRGEGPISLEKFTGGILKIPAEATIFPQPEKSEAPPKVRLSKGDEKEIEKELRKRSDVTYGFIKSPREHGVDILVQFQNGKPIRNSTADIITYNRELVRYEGMLIKHYDEEDPIDAGIIKEACIVVTQHTEGTPDYQKSLLRQAMKLHVPTDQLQQWIYKYEKNPLTIEKKSKILQKKKEEEIKTLIEYMVENNDMSILQTLKEEYDMSNEDIKEKVKKYSSGINAAIEQKRIDALPPGEKYEKTIIDVEKLLVPLDEIKEFKSGVGKPDYIPVSGNRLLDIYKSPAKERLGWNRDRNGNVMYYFNTIGMSSERKRAISKINTRRVAYRLKRKSGISNKKIVRKIENKKIIRRMENKKVQKCSRSSNMKKCLLDKLRCKCRRKK